jgi:predicted nucleotide-binding protein (sugar kinase/HSP70/actin superfamily)|tara:strand:- start:43 stop:252 length:210 start_codon:yes stop_codon:yes gene_type:complete
VPNILNKMISFLENSKKNQLEEAQIKLADNIAVTKQEREENTRKRSKELEELRSANKNMQDKQRDMGNN